MINGIQVALKNAIDAIVPPATPLQDFNYHWKQLMNFYVNHLSDTKIPIYESGIPRHLDRLLEILLREERNEHHPGPCMEYLHQHKLLDLLTTLASAETPPGMRPVCFAFFRKLLSRSKQPLLHHASICCPVQKLINLCNGSIPSPHETEEIQFLLTLCYLICKYPDVTSIINDSPKLYRQHTSNHVLPVKEKSQLRRITYVPVKRKNSFNPLFQPLDTQAVTIVNPNLFLSGSSHHSNSSFLNRAYRKYERVQSYRYIKSNDSMSSKDTDNVSQSSSSCTEGDKTRQLPDSPALPISELAHVPDLTALGLNSDFNDCLKDHNNDKIEPNILDSSENKKSKCLLLDALISYLNSADNTVRVRACEGIMVLASLEDPCFTHVIAKSDLAITMALRLENLFNIIPAHIDPNEINRIDVTWGLDSPLWTNERIFPGCRQVAAFFMWFDYCDQLIREAQLEVAHTLAKTIRINFFEKIVTPALSDHHVVLITALITKCLKDITSSIFCDEMSYWLVGEERDLDTPGVWTSPVLHRLIENCFSDSNDLVIETLKFFEEAIEKRNEHTLHCLALVYLTNRSYYDNTAADSTIASWSDEEDERERGKKSSFDLSYDQCHSRTLAPSNIHRIVNCFLSLVPRCLQTEFDVSHYERYMADWERQYATVLSDCSLMAWPLEAVSIDDSASSDSRPEADHCTTRFFMGPFLSMLFDKVCNIPQQKYEVNLQLTVVISRLALLPHPYLHEFLLNPLVPLVPEAKCLFTCLQKVVKQLVNEVTKIPDYKLILKNTREELLDECTSARRKENILYESVIIMEEFCKELAAIAYVKYHHSLQ